jgi:hypothetical protein
MMADVQTMGTLCVSMVLFLALGPAFDRMTHGDS